MRGTPLLAICGTTLAALGALMLNLRAEAPEHFGVAASNAQGACVAFPNLTADTPPNRPAITLVVPREPQTFWQDSLGAPLPFPCEALASADVPGPYFALTVDHEHQGFGLAIALPSQWSVKSTRSGVRASGRSSSNIAFRSCTSREGVHLTAWQGKPLKGHRLWHEYFYLGYDVEPSCTPKDYE